MSTQLLPDIVARPAKNTSLFTSLLISSAAHTALINTESARLTLLVPLNTYIESLPSKVWNLYPPAELLPASLLGASPPEGTGPDFFIAKQNEHTFLAHHIVQAYPWNEGEKANAVAGEQLWWEMRGEKRIIMPAEIEVISVEGSVANGQLWIIGGVLGAPKGN